MTTAVMAATGQRAGFVRAEPRTTPLVDGLRATLTVATGSAQDNR